MCRASRVGQAEPPCLKREASLSMHGSLVREDAQEAERHHSRIGVRAASQACRWSFGRYGLHYTVKNRLDQLGREPKCWCARAVLCL